MVQFEPANNYIIAILLLLYKTWFIIKKVKIFRISINAIFHYCIVVKLIEKIIVKITFLRITPIQIDNVCKLLLLL